MSKKALTFWVLGVALWLAYGLVLGAWPIVVANLITLLLAAAILVMKIVHDRPAKERRSPR